MTIGYFAPRENARSGVADYASQLKRALALNDEIRANRYGGVNLYHLGNNQLHKRIYEHALARPGVAVLHDAVLHHFYLGALARQSYIDEFVYNYGEWERSYAGQLWAERSQSASGSRYFSRPMLRRIAECSKAIVVHNPAAAEIVKRHAPNAHVIEIPHLFADPIEPAQPRERTRQRLGISPGAFVFGVFGFLRESKRLAAILDCFAALRPTRPNATLLVAGEFSSPDLRRALEGCLTKPGIVRCAYLPESEFLDIAHAVDACINLRVPSSGETSGIGIRLMGAGKPVFFTEAPELARIPEFACIRVAAGLEERASLFEHMDIALLRPDVLRAIGVRAREHVHRFHSLSCAVRLYREVLYASGAGASSRP